MSAQASYAEALFCFRAAAVYFRGPTFFRYVAPFSAPHFTFAVQMFTYAGGATNGNALIPQIHFRDDFGASQD